MNTNWPSDNDIAAANKHEGNSLRRFVDAYLVLILEHKHAMDFLQQREVIHGKDGGDPVSATEGHWMKSVHNVHKAIYPEDYPEPEKESTHPYGGPGEPEQNRESSI